MVHLKILSLPHRDRAQRTVAPSARGAGMGRRWQVLPGYRDDHGREHGDGGKAPAARARKARVEHHRAGGLKAAFQNQIYTAGGSGPCLPRRAGPPACPAVRPAPLITKCEIFPSVAGRISGPGPPFEPGVWNTRLHRCGQSHNLRNRLRSRPVHKRVEGSGCQYGPASLARPWAPAVQPSGARPGTAVTAGRRATC